MPVKTTKPLYVRIVVATKVVLHLIDAFNSRCVKKKKKKLVKASVLCVTEGYFSVVSRSCKINYFIESLKCKSGGKPLTIVSLLK